MARPTKYSKERGDKIARLIQGGNYAHQAAAAAGVSESTFYRWINLGKEVEKKYGEWLENDEVWQELSDEQKAEKPHLKPLESEGPTEEEIGFLQFYKSVKKAEAEAEAAAVVQIKAAAASGTWQAAAWFLERKFKDRWARTDKLEGTVNHQIGIGATKEELEAAKARLQEARSKELPPSPEEVIDAETLED